MDTDSSPAPAPAPRPPDAPPCSARWRGRPVAADSRPPGEPPWAELATHATPEHSAQRPARDAELWLLARRTHGAAVRIDFELHTSFVRQVFRRDFVYVSRLLHALQASRRVQGLDRPFLDEALAALHRRADEVQSLLQGLQARLQATIAAHAPPDAQLAFARPARFQATIVSPFAHRYLALLILADATLGQLEMTWLLGLVAPADRAALTSDCRRALAGFKDLVAERRQAVGEQVRVVNAQRRGLATAPQGAPADH